MSFLGITGKKANGFASPAQGYEDTSIDLNELLIKRPASTYFFRLESAEMTEFGLLDGALLVVDRSKVPILNSIVIVRHEGQFLCRLMLNHNGYTVFSNGKNEILPLIDDTEIIGVVTASIQIYDIPY